MNIVEYIQSRIDEIKLKDKQMNMVKRDMSMSILQRGMARDISHDLEGRRNELEELLKLFPTPDTEVVKVYSIPPKP